LESIYRLYEQGLTFRGIHILDPSLEVFAADGAPRRAIHLSKGELLLPDKLVEMCQNFKTEIVFLNTCISAWYGRMLSQEGVLLTVITTLPVRAKDAWYGALRFWKTVADMEMEAKNGKRIDLREAVKALPTDGLYDYRFSEAEEERHIYGSLVEQVAELTVSVEDNTMGLKVLGEERKADWDKLDAEMSHINATVNEAAQLLTELREKTRPGDIRLFTLVLVGMTVFILANTLANVWQGADIQRLSDLVASLLRYWGAPGAPLP